MVRKTPRSPTSKRGCATTVPSPIRSCDYCETREGSNSNQWFEAFLDGRIPSFDEITKLVDEQVKERMEDEVWINDLYQVAVRRADDWTGPDGERSWPELIHLSIKRIDRRPIHDWHDLQEIKNQLVGPEHEAVELYPAESRRVDSFKGSRRISRRRFAQ